ncbi:MAG: hypothetical protein M1826_006700 [Phylliscum demangeonii]|nr:MAG: hypothetical protein M1826_006700 [Phylliscum demangeonii]
MRVPESIWMVLVAAPILTTWALPHPESADPNANQARKDGGPHLDGGKVVLGYVGAAAAGAGVGVLGTFALMSTKIHELRSRLDKARGQLKASKQLRINARTKHNNEAAILREDVRDMVAEMERLQGSPGWDESSRVLFEDVRETQTEWYRQNPIQVRVSDGNYEPWLIPRDMPDFMMECAYDYLNIVWQHDNRLTSVKGSAWDRAIDDCAAYHQLKLDGKSHWKLGADADMKIVRLHDRKTIDAFYKGEGWKVRELADARKAAAAETHKEAKGLPPNAFLHAAHIPSWLRRNVMHLGKAVETGPWANKVKNAPAWEEKAVSLERHL